MFREWLKETLATAYPGHPFDVLIPPDETMGDYSVNLAFGLAKARKTNPMDVARDIVKMLDDAPGSNEYCRAVAVAAPGFVNITLRHEYLRAALTEITEKKGRYGTSDVGKGKRIIVEYPSTNVAKPLHVGHSRVVFIGDALANIFSSLGYEVIRWDHVGDWGTQFGALIAAYAMWGEEADVEAEPMETLLSLYVRFSAAAKDDPSLQERARQEFKKLEEGDEANTKLWQWFKDESLREAQQLYNSLSMHPADQTVGESAYLKEMGPLVKEMLDAGIAERNEGAVIVRLDDFELPPALLQKSDGASLYLTRDIASLRYRLGKFKPSKVLYVVGNEQALHFEQLFSIAQKLHLSSAELVHVKFGLILGEDRKKFATREGKLVLLQDVVEKITALAAQVVQQKNPDLPQDSIAVIARAVGIGALKYNDLREARTSDIIFDWNAMLDLAGDSGPYLQYTYARLANVVAKAEPGKADVSLLTHPTEHRLMLHLLEFPYAIAQCATAYTTNGLALYLHQLANHANRFYENVRVREEENDARRGALILLVTCVREVLGHGLGLLGISVLERI